MTSAIFSVAIILGLAACTNGVSSSPEEHRPAGMFPTPSAMACVISSDFSPGDRLIVQAAFLDWSVATDGEFSCASWDGVPGGIGVISVHHAELEGGMIGSTTSTQASGSTWDGADIAISPTVTPEGLRGVVAHEVGHALRLHFSEPACEDNGWHYTGEQPSIMRHFYRDQAPAIGAIDVAAFRVALAASR